MLLSEHKVWNVVNGDYPRPKTVEEYTTDEQAKLTAAIKKQKQTDVDEWEEINEEALRIICFTVSDQLQELIRYGKTAKGAWDELQHVHASNNKQRKNLKESGLNMT